MSCSSFDTHSAWSKLWSSYHGHYHHHVESRETDYVPESRETDYVKHFTESLLVYLILTTLWVSVLLSSFYGWGNCCSERLNDFPKVRAYGRGGISIQIYMVPEFRFTLRTSLNQYLESCLRMFSLVVYLLSVFQKVTSMTLMTLSTLSTPITPAQCVAHSSCSINMCYLLSL